MQSSWTLKSAVRNYPVERIIGGTMVNAKMAGGGLLQQHWSLPPLIHPPLGALTPLILPLLVVFGVLRLHRQWKVVKCQIQSARNAEMRSFSLFFLFFLLFGCLDREPLAVEPLIEFISDPRRGNPLQCPSQRREAPLRLTILKAVNKVTANTDP